MIGIIHVGDVKNSPYLEKYIKILEENNEKYDVIFWDRENKDLEYPSNYLFFKKKMEYKKKPIMKVLDFIQFAAWVNKTIKHNKYDKLIVVLTLSGIFLANTLLRNYSNKYIFDIRDYSYEGINLFYNIEKKIISNSYFTCISSYGFKEFLPKNYPYVMAHNFNYNDLQYKKSFKKKERGSSLNLVWNGGIRYFEHQSQIIDKLKNDKRFNIIYHGTGSEIELFKKFCNENRIENVTFTGAYQNLDKYKLLYDADILNNSYGSKNQSKVKYAIANKYYDGLIFGIPQLIETGTYKHKRVEDKGVGIGLDVSNPNFGDQLYEYYFNLNEEEFNENCDQEINNVIKEDKFYLEKIKEFIKQ